MVEKQQQWWWWWCAGVCFGSAAHKPVSAAQAGGRVAHSLRRRGDVVLAPVNCCDAAEGLGPVVQAHHLWCVCVSGGSGSARHVADRCPRHAPGCRRERVCASAGHLCLLHSTHLYRLAVRAHDKWPAIGAQHGTLHRPSLLRCTAHGLLPLLRRRRGASRGAGLLLPSRCHDDNTRPAEAAGCGWRPAAAG